MHGWLFDPDTFVEDVAGARMAEGKPSMDGQARPASGVTLDRQQLLDALPMAV